MLTTHQVLAVLLGIGWATALLGYGRLANGAAVDVPDRGGVSVLGRVIDVVLVGGGTGVFLYLTDSRLASFAYGLAGVVLVAVAALATWTAGRRPDGSRG